MTIETLKHQYYILQKVRETEKIDHFLCREEMGNNKKALYDVFKIKERSLVVKLILIFTEQMSNVAFTDFCECFSKDGDLYLVFVHKKTVSLLEKLERENCSRKERSLIGKKIMEQILLLNMPDFLADDILNVRQIQISPAMDVSFLYELKEIDRFETVTIQKIQDKLSAVLELLFSYEISLQISEDITVFLKQLKQGEYAEYMQIYQAYLQLLERLENAETVLKPNTFWFRVWDKVKEIWKKLKSFILVFVVIGVVGYLIYSIMNPVPNTEERFLFQRIGTLTIIEGQEDAPDTDEGKNP